MRLVSFGPPHGEQPGALADDATVVPLNPFLDRFGIRGADMSTVVGLLAYLREDLEREVAAPHHTIAVSDVRLGPPIVRPRHIAHVGGNYRAHLEEGGLAPEGLVTRKPILTSKPPTALIGSSDPIVRPRETRQLDYEIELAVVIGRQGRRIRRQDALAFVAGYMICNDVTARDVIMADVDVNPLFMQMMRGKGYDTFMPAGPWIRTADEIDDPARLQLDLSVNGEPRQHASASEMRASVPEIVESVSEVMTLFPGDVIMTGSPSGVGANMRTPAFLQPGDVLRSEISELGRMENLITEEA
jgi:2,4-didehydro-3-deoxy-L-rhamnonate hydrolase